MIKKKIILNTLLIIIAITIILIYVKKNDEYSVYEESNIKFAILLDGKKIKKLPERDFYNVEVTCKNARGKWDYDNWKADIGNISDDVECNLYFTTITKMNLNDKIMSLVNQNQNQGKVVFEQMSSSPPTLVWNDVSQDLYGNVFSSSAISSTSGTSVDVFSFDGTNWNSITDNMIKNMYYNMNLDIKNPGYYQLCYTLGNGGTSNTLSVYQGTSKIETINSKTSSQVSGCIDIGYVSKSTTYRVVQQTSTTTSYPSIPVYKFKVQKANGFIDYRYQGKNPNNYIWFNNELWRIIGVFDEATHGLENQKLVKIVRNEPIGALSWSKNGSEWSSSNINSLLNNYYYLQKDGTSSSYCYGNAGSVSASCDYSGIGINSQSRRMVKNVKWYLNGSEGGTAEVMYNDERNGTSTIDAHLGLIYPSDYGFAAPANSCVRSYKLSSYANCTDQNWLYGWGHEWTITKIINLSYSSSSAFFIRRNGALNFNASSEGADNKTALGYSVRPTLYLDSSVYVAGGDGSYNNPYYIKMD